jgi:hypothetical protein
MTACKPIWNPLIVGVCIVVSLIFVTGCRPEPVAPDDATVLILDPPANARLSGPDVTVRTFVNYLTLVEPSGQADKPGEGHLVYYMDVDPPVARGQSALTAQGTCSATTARTHVWNAVSPGNHVFWVQLVSNNNTPLEPPAAVRVPVTVK